MSKCYYIHDKKAGKVLIPECWGAALTGDIANCCCDDTPKIQELENRIIKLEKGKQ